MENSNNMSIQQQISALRRASGCCTSCNNPSVIGKTYCEYHIQKRREWESKRRAIRLSKNGCGSCATGIPLANTVLCLKCWWQSKATYIGSIAIVKQLQELWENQKGLCALSGLPLIPGTNASIDHIVPKSKGGTNDISNLRWVLTSVNSGRHDLSDEEFINICKAIVSNNENKSLTKLDN